jgi:uncharacterized protein (TIGR02246 family)
VKNPFPSTPAECDSHFAECVQSGDLEGLVALYEPDARLMQYDGTVANGHVEIRRVLASLMAAAATIDVRVATAIETGDLAVLYNDWQWRSVAADGTVTQRSGKAIEILRRQQDGRWLFVIDDPFARSRNVSRAL